MHGIDAPLPRPIAQPERAHDDPVAMRREHDRHARGMGRDLEWRGLLYPTREEAQRGHRAKRVDEVLHEGRERDRASRPEHPGNDLGVQREARHRAPQNHQHQRPQEHNREPHVRAVEELASSDAEDGTEHDRPDADSGGESPDGERGCDRAGAGPDRVAQHAQVVSTEALQSGAEVLVLHEAIRSRWAGE